MSPERMGFFELLAANPTLLIACCSFLGLLIGSFLNVVIHRIPIMMDNALRDECAALAAADAPTIAASTALQGELAFTDDGAEPATPEGASPAADSKPATYNLIVPASACPACKAPITAEQNIPVVSWLLLRGRCASCGIRISARYPLVELATAILSGVVAWRFGFGVPMLGALAFTWLLIALTMIDFDTQFLPDPLTYPLLWLGLLMSLAHPVWAEGAGPVTPVDSIVGATAGYLSLWSVFWLFKWLTGKEGMGYGDFKLFAALGAWLGWQMLLPVILFASAVGAVVGIVLMVRKREGFDGQIPFGPFLAVAGWLALMMGHDVISRYFASWESVG